MKFNLIRILFVVILKDELLLSCFCSLRKWNEDVNKCNVVIVEIDIPESPLCELSRSGWPSLHTSPLCRRVQPSGGGGVFTTAWG